MPDIHVCPLSRIHDLTEATGARTLVTLINVNTPVKRPPSIEAARHLYIGVSDIVDALDGHVLPAEAHVGRLLGFVRDWDRAAPLLIHCWAGVSRSTAAAFISACLLRPERDEAEFARLIRERSPTATPNAKLVALADDMLNRRGRMVDAVRAIGRGADCFEGVPFRLEIGAP